MPWARKIDITPKADYMRVVDPEVPWYAIVRPWGRWSWSIVVTNHLEDSDTTFVLGSRQRAQRRAERMVRRRIAADARRRGDEGFEVTSPEVPA